MSDNTLSNSARCVQDALIKKGLELTVKELPASTRTANDAAATIGCEVAQIVKSLVFRAKGSNKPILVLASGINRVNEKLIEAEINETIEKADADYTREVTGFAIGGIPPLGHREKIRTFIDIDLLNYHQLWAAAGTPNAVFCFNSADIENMTDGKIIAIK